MMLKKMMKANLIFFQNWARRIGRK